MLQTIVSNNCSGGAIMHELEMEFRTPTINLQILPEEYPRFCKYFRDYMSVPLIEYVDPCERHRKYLTKMFGGVPKMPFGLVEDVIVCFQHYDSFYNAKKKWDERRNRIDFENIGFLFHARGPEYREEAETFLTLGLEHQLLLTQGFEVDGGIRFDGDAFEAVDGHLRITKVYNFGGWINGTA